MKFIGCMALVGLAAACGTTESSAPGAATTTTANVSAVTSDSAIERITNARCSREFSCDNIGAGRVWRDYESCTRDVRLSMRGMLVGQVCTSGVDSRQLSSCLSDIGNVACGSPHGTIEPFAACSNAKLCR
jgi:hypothetical protein